MNPLYIKQRTEHSIFKIEAVLQTQYPELKITEIKPYANGVENVVFKAQSPVLGDIVIRTPIEQVVKNDNDGEFHASRLLKKEMNLTKHAAKHGIPVAKIYQTHFGSDIDFTVGEYVKSDGSDVSVAEVGELLTKLHNMPLPDESFTKQSAKEYYKPIAERIIARTNVVEKILKTRLPLCSVEELCSIFRNWDAKLVLNHLDIRPANFITYEGKIKALLDWSNALIGDPTLEIMRILEQEEIDPRFLENYTFASYVNTVPEVIKVLYRYDAIVMMAVLFLSEIQDAKMGKHYYNKLVNIHKMLKTNL